MLGELRKVGVKLAVDDFGTGYSSLSCLRRFPIDQLEIDRFYVADMADMADMADNADDAAIVGAIVLLGRSLGLELVAEGVETRRQASMLREMGCDTLQGYYFSRPVPADEIAALLGGDPFSLEARHSTRSMVLDPALSGA